MNNNLIQYMISNSTTDTQLENMKCLYSSLLKQLEAIKQFKNI